MDRTLEVLIQKIEEKRIGITESLGDGAAKDFADYKYSCGVVRGLLVASSLIADLAKNLENFNE